MKRLIVGLAVVVLGTGQANAGVFNMGPGLTSLEFVPVGDPGNEPDTRYETPGYGGVDYTYNIGKYEVTAGQYRDFLNAVDPTGENSLGLYNPWMDISGFGCQITWNSSTSTYDFSGRPSATEADWANRPVNYVSFWDAARFCNWLQNGQGSGDTESGAYINIGNQTTFARQPGTLFFIPTEDEWYKAAYHKNDGDTGNYFDYPTSSDTTPSHHLIDPDPGNNATFLDPDSYTIDLGYTIGSPYYRTEVGAHENSESPYGTFDQGGNVWEWNETADGSYRGFRGGSLWYIDYTLLVAHRHYGNPADEFNDVGFRVASNEVIPEPSTLVLLSMGALTLTIGWWRRRRAA